MFRTPNFARPVLIKLRDKDKIDVKVVMNVYRQTITTRASAMSFNLQLPVDPRMNKILTL